MLQISHQVLPFIRALSRFFQDAPGWGLKQFTLKDRGRFDVTTRQINYGLGPKWSMRYVDDTSELLVFVVLGIDNNGRASISYQGNGLCRQWKLNLFHDTKNVVEAGTGEPENLLTWLLSLPESQLDILSGSLHEQARDNFIATKSPKIVLDMRTLDSVQTPTQESESNPDNFSVSMIYKSTEAADYVVMVFNVTRKSGSVDRYSVSVKSKSILLNSLLGLYRRGFFGRFMKTLNAEAKHIGDGSHIQAFSKVDLHRQVAVCVTRPKQNGIEDEYFVPGRSYAVKDIVTIMGGEEFVVLTGPDGDIERRTNHFVVYGR